jgi:hypothetical protein
LSLLLESRLPIKGRIRFSFGFVRIPTWPKSGDGPRDSTFTGILPEYKLLDGGDNEREGMVDDDVEDDVVNESPKCFETMMTFVVWL